MYTCIHTYAHMCTHKVFFIPNHHSRFCVHNAAMNLISLLLFTCVCACMYTYNHKHTHTHRPGVPNDHACMPVCATLPQTRSQPFGALVRRSLPCEPNALCRPLEFWQQPVECDLWRAVCVWRGIVFCPRDLCTLTVVWWLRTRPTQVPAVCM
jgi:hypothetical protein